MKKLTNKKGFTLVELIVVMVILGILAVILIPRMMTIQDSAKASACQANQRSLASMTHLWIARNPATNSISAGTMNKTTGESTAGNPDLATLVSVGYINTLADAKCPSDGTLSITADGKWTCDQAGHGTVPATDAPRTTT